MRERLAPEQFDTLADAPDPRESLTVAGHDEAVAQLVRAYANGKLHHAVLLAGPRGIGKATLAFRFAGHVLANPDPAAVPLVLSPPAGDSALFRQIASGGHPGILHLSRPFDEKRKLFRTAITVEEIRRVGRFVGTTQHDGGWRIVIVDTADDLNPNAANALLKSLEEPPSRTFFLILAHQPGRLVATIRSRCQMLRLQPLGDADLLAALAAANMRVPDSESDALLRRAKGSVREALLLAANGGLELSGVADRILGEPAFNVVDAARLADVVAARDETIRFDLVNRHLLDRIAEAASMAPSSAEADRFAALWQDANAAIALTATYNLDKRQHLNGLLRRMHEAGVGPD